MIDQEKQARKAGMISQVGLSKADLDATIKGKTITPGDPGYDEARTLFYGGFDHHPAVIVRVADASDVSKVISLARENGLELAVRSGGHSLAGHSVPEGGIMLDLGDMRALEIDIAGRTAWAEAGLTTGEFTIAAAEHGLAVGFGDTGSVGIGGITLGGGIGYFVRKYGLTIDHLLAAEVVTADGQILQVNARSHPDLFWAIRGGGGNFGVATRFQYRLNELGTVVGGMIFLPATTEVVAGFIAAAEAAPEELSTIANILPAPPMPFLPPELYGKLVVMGMLVFSGEAEAGQRALAPFRELAEPIVDMLRPMRYPEMFPPEQEDYHPLAVSRTMFIDRVDHQVAETILQTLQNSDAEMRVAQLRVLGGAMARVPMDATAFAHRNSRIMVNIAAFFEGQEEKLVRDAWVAEFASAIHQDDTGAYVNFMGEAGQQRIHQAYPGATLERLAGIKAHYDPGNLFHHNQNIPPK